jgi:hypothetical protein
MSWETIRTEQYVVHVVPTDDDHEHYMGVFGKPPIPYCACSPRTEQSAKGMLIVIHGYFDGREALEYVRDILDGNDKNNAL